MTNVHIDIEVKESTIEDPMVLVASLGGAELQFRVERTDEAIDNLQHLVNNADLILVTGFEAVMQSVKGGE